MNKPKILIVDDHPENLVALHAVLNSPEYTVTECASGKEALNCLLNEEFDLILMDVQMPEMDGFATASLIRARQKCESIPLIFITARMLDEESTIKGYETGCVDYITKPFNPATLRRKVDFFLSYKNQIRKERQHKDFKEEFEKFSKVFEDIIDPLWAVLLNVQMLKKYTQKGNEKLSQSLRPKLECMEDATRRLKNLIVSYRSHIKELDRPLIKSSSESAQFYSHLDPE